ncbi:lysostaphin resistance A-like protein [Celeribacter sp. ULVN23_4]
MRQQMHPYAPIVASAMRRPELWRLAVAIVAALLISIVVTPLFYLIIGRLAPNLMPFQLGPRGMMVGTTPGGLFVILSGFIILLWGALQLAKRLHARSLREITGPAALMRAQFLVTLKWIIAFTLLSFFLPWDGPADPVANLPGGLWLFWLPFAILGLMVQVTAEEVFFRGYLQSQFIGVTRSYPLGVAASAVIFGLAHTSGSAEGIAAIFPVVWAIGFGVLAGDLTMRAGTIGPAIALHFVNNLSAMVLAPQQDMMSGFGLFVQTESAETLYSDPKALIFQSLLLLVSWLVARLAIRR